MAFESISDSIFKFEALIGDSDPKKGIPLDANKFKELMLTTNLFSIAPVCTLVFEFEQYDNKPKPFDEIYVKVYKNIDGDSKGALILSAVFTVLSISISTLSTYDGIFDRYILVCTTAPLYTLTHKMNVAYNNKNSIEVIREILGVDANLSYNLMVENGLKTNDTMNWVFSQKTSLEMLKKTLRHMSLYGNEKDIPLLYSEPNRETKLTSLVNLTKKNPKCTLIDTNTYDTIDKDDQKEYLKFFNNTVGVYKGAIPLLSNGFGQMMYQYNPWADNDYGQGLVGMVARAIQFAADIVNEELKPLDSAFRHPDKVIDNCVYRAYESFNFNVGSIMPGTPIKPYNKNKNISTLKYVGIHTPELHTTYNVRPDIYENIVRNFFINSVNVICYTQGQHDKYNDFSQFPKLGDCVNLSLNTKDTIENVRNGKYLIGKYTILIKGNNQIPVIQYTLFKDTMNIDEYKEDLI